MTQPRIGIFIGNKDRVRFEPDLLIYEAALAVPLTPAQKALMNSFYLTLKLGLSISLLSEAFDAMWFLGNETSDGGLKNIVKRLHDCTLVNAPTFTALEGFTGEATKYLRTDFIPATDGIRYTQNSASLGAYSRTSGINNDYCIIGGTGGSPYTGITGIYPRIAGNIAARINGGSDTNVVNAESTGMYVICRTSSTSVSIYKNGGAPTIASQTSTGLSSVEYYILARNVGGSPSPYSTYQCSMAFAGRSLSQAEVTVLTNAFETYMDANGKGVI